jgi:hypothetical protein
MPLQSEGRNFAEVGTDTDKVNYQRFEHTPLDVLTYEAVFGEAPLPEGTKHFVSVRIYCPDIRVVSRIACIFEPLNPNNRQYYDLSELKSDIVAYRAMNAQTRIARVGEIIGKNGVPFEFPKSNIDGVAFQNEDDMPWIDVDLNLAFPGCPGKWVMYYHATSNNKLKCSEWEGYISRVTMSVQSSPGTVKFGGLE